MSNHSLNVGARNEGDIQKQKQKILPWVIAKMGATQRKRSNNLNVNFLRFFPLDCFYLCDMPSNSFMEKLNNGET